MTTTLDLNPPDTVVKFRKGSTLNPIFFYVGPKPTYTMIDLSSGYSARMQARLTVDSTTVLDGFDLTTANSGLVLVQQSVTLHNGTVLTDRWGVQLNVSATVTAAITWTQAVFDIELITGTTVIPLVSGILIPTDEVTR